MMDDGIVSQIIMAARSVNCPTTAIAIDSIANRIYVGNLFFEGPVQFLRTQTPCYSCEGCSWDSCPCN